MGKRSKVALAVLVVALASVIVSVIVWQLLQRREPEYQGYSLSSWLNNVEYTGKLSASAAEAVRQMGTEALPTLLRMLRAKDSSLKLQLMDWAARQPFVKIEHTPAEELNLRAKCAFAALGAKAQSAVPALIEIANQKISLESQTDAIHALGFIGPPAKEAVPSLLRWATNADQQVRFGAIYALGEIHAQPDRVLPVLINALHDPASGVQHGAVWALQYFGPDAKVAVPALAELLNAPYDYESRFAATNALKAIDPEAAAKAGVK
jgi:HEAT repeat protein